MSRPMSRLLTLVPIQPLLPLILITPLQEGVSLVEGVRIFLGWRTFFHILRDDLGGANDGVLR